MRIALCLRLGEYDVHPEVEANLRPTTAALADAGARVEEIELPWTKADPPTAVAGHFSTIFGAQVTEVAQTRADDLTPYARNFVDAAARARARIATACRGRGPSASGAACSPQHLYPFSRVCVLEVSRVEASGGRRTVRTANPRPALPRRPTARGADRPATCRREQAPARGAAAGAESSGVLAQSVAGVLLLVWWPLILRQGGRYTADASLSADGFLDRWLPIAASLFLASPSP
ncbi:hypothetical protein [Streptomyces sp. NPDC020362]|uniref:hypothetical protein n=1 Tax=unclassified Streptomyces TaxID=2593676 RepID=UPI0033E18FF4